MEEEDLQAEEIYQKTLARLRDEINKAGLTQERLAEIVGVAQGTISRWLSGKRGDNLPLRSALKIAVTLNIDLTSLYQDQARSKTPSKEELKSLRNKLGKIISEIDEKMIVNG